MSGKPPKKTEMTPEAAKRIDESNTDPKFKERAKVAAAKNEEKKQSKQPLNPKTKAANYRL